MDFLNNNINKKTSFIDLLRNCTDNFYLKPTSYKTVKINKKFLKFYLSKIKKNKIIINFDNKDKLYLPYMQMGIPSSINLFAYHEHNIFLYYLNNFGRYKKIADIGANIGLHSIVLSKIGYKVDVYEPDPDHFKLLKKNLKMNKCKNVKFYNNAIFDKTKNIKFTQVINNTAANHINGFKDNLHGPIKTFKVRTIDIKKIVKNYDLIKIDAEGSEANIIERLSHNDFNKVDIICEISGNKNAKRIFKNCKNKNINIFSHKIGWQKAKKIKDVPTHHTEGLVFLSNKNLMDLFPKKTKKK
jgi:FkbM family methyltransferase